MRFRESTPSLTSYACLETRSLLPRFGTVSSRPHVVMYLRSVSVPGVNFPLSDLARSQGVCVRTRIMLRRTDRQRSKTRVQIEFIDPPGERIPLPDASVDTVVSMLTLCTIADRAAALFLTRIDFLRSGRLCPARRVKRE